MESRRTFAIGFILSVVLLAAVVAGHTDTFSPGVRHFEFTYVAHVPKLSPDASLLRLWIPLPREDGFQTITDLRISSPLPYTEHRDPEYGNRYLYVEASAARLKEAPIEVQLRFHVDRREHRINLDSRSSGFSEGKKEDPAHLARFLKPDRLVPTDGVIAALAEQETRGLTTPLEKARAIYNYVVATLRYDKSGEGWGRGDAIFACTAKRGNCTDFHSLFIGMMRAAGIPARFEIGFPLPPDQTQGAIPGYHCWAEFYLAPLGWIPVDASEAWKHPEKRQYFFGAHDAHRVLFTMGRDIRFNPAQQGDPVNYFVYPYAELDGKAFSGVQYAFSFQDRGGATQ